MEVHVNYLAVLVAALANYLIAFIWYAAIFGKLWKKTHRYYRHETCANEHCTGAGRIFSAQLCAGPRHYLWRRLPQDERHQWRTNVGVFQLVGIHRAGNFDHKNL